MNITALLRDVVKKDGTKTAVIENGREISYRDLWDRIEKLSAAFHEIGIGEDDRVALILPNSSDFIYCFFALLKINAIVTPLSPDCTPYELKGIFDNLHPLAIIASSSFIEKVVQENIIILDNKLLIFQDTVPSSLTSVNAYELKNLSKSDEKYNVNMQTGDGDIATINYTYRGYGYPLGAILSHDNYLQAAMFYIKRTRLTDQHSILLVLPSYHVFTLMGGIIAPLLAGATVVLAKSFIISHIIEIIKKYQITMLLAVPTLYRLIISYTRNPSDMSSVRCCITGGDLMSAGMLEELRTKFNTEVLQGYGLTECLPVTCNPFHKNKVGSLGSPGRADVNIKIVNDSGDELDPGAIGEIIVNGPTVMSGYYKLSEVTRNVLKDGWLYTGDYGFLDSEGYLYMSGLKKNIVKVGGKIVDIEEVRNVLLSHPFIEEASLHSKEDRLWGNIIEAEITTTANRELIESEIKMFCSKRLSAYKVPKIIRCSAKVGVS